MVETGNPFSVVTVSETYIVACHLTDSIIETKECCA